MFRWMLRLPRQPEQTFFENLDRYAGDSESSKGLVVNRNASGLQS